MKRKLCIGLGIAMIALVGVMASGVVGTEDSMFRVVSTGEAELVLGGGQGANYVQGTCGNRESGDPPAGCTAEGLYSSGSKTPGERATSTATCGGSCGNVILKREAVE